ncbi:hypothetical protein OPQ81_009123 [Rhizoctonia solani]|nr:hypothetical protein OPQ81_009123 [Rhizoctonia solani]
MMLLSRVLPALLAVSGLVQAASVAVRTDESFFQEFVNELKDNNLTILADNYKRIADTNEGKSIVNTLKNGGELTILAPEDDAFDREYTSLDPNVIKYSTLWGSIDKNFQTADSWFTRRGASKSHSTARSTFRRPGSGGGSKRDIDKNELDKFQVQVVDKFNNDELWKRWTNHPLILIDRAVGSAKVVNRFTFKKIIVLIIDTVLTLPARVSELLCKPLINDAPNGFTKAAEALNKTGLIDLVDTRDALTAFVPVDESLGDMHEHSDSELTSLLKNHFFFGTIVYTTLFPKICEATAESGKELKFTFENDINYVSCGKTKAIILRGDVISTNGVIHIIDRPLVWLVVGS